MTTLDEIMQQLEDCEKRESKLTDWERSFIDSLQKCVADGRGLTGKQLNRLDDIWDRVTG